MKSYRRLCRGLLSMRQSEGFGCPYEVRQGPYAHLPHNVTSMDLDGDFTEPKLPCHLFVHQSGGDKRHDFPLARRERLEQSAQFGKRLFGITSLAVPFD